MQYSPSPRIRKDIRAVAPAQRARFFYCLKLLTVLPPRQGTKRVFHVAWKIQNGQRFFKTVVPSNIHDQFISSHQTCCEHGAPYFPYYHRHLLVSLELELNAAEQILLTGRTKLPTQFYNRYSSQFDAVFLQYRSIISSFRNESKIGVGERLPQISLHYWNSTDYTQDILIPSQISEREPDQMDKLCFAVNKHYPWNFNFATRWFRDQGVLPKGFQTNGFFLNEPATYSPTEQLILNNQLNPRTQNTDRFFWGSNENSDTGIFGLADTAAKVNAYRNYQSLTTDGGMDVCAMNQSQLNAIFGSRKSRLHWINKAQRAKLNSLSGQTLALAYNRLLPHYQYAYSLFKSSNSFLRNFVSTYNQNFQNSFQNAHNTIHNSLQLFMSDAQLSITNLLFFLYHSWIDLALQTKIRMIRTSNNNNKESQATRQFLDNIKPNSILDQVTSPKGPITYGNYNIFQWAIPISRLQTSGLILKPADYEVAFQGRGYVFNQKANSIRRSDQLHDFYQTQYVSKVTARYASFSGFSQFNYNYNFEIADYGPNGILLTVMRDNVVPIQSYIQAIYDEYGTEWNGNLTRSISVAPPPAISLFSADRMEFPTPQASDMISQEKYYDQKYHLRAIRASITGYATFSSTVRSTVLPILLEVTPEGFKQIAFNAQEIEVMKTGLIISTVPLLTRGSGAIVCPNCKVEKELWIECSQNLAEMNQGLFCTIARGLNREVIYRVRNNKEDPIHRLKLSDLLRLHTPRPVFNTLRLIEGAVQVSFVVNFEGKEDYKTSSVKINGFSYEVQSQKLHNIASKKKENLKCEIELPQVIGVLDQDSQHSRYTYRLIKVFIINGNQSREFQFPINTYHELIRYRIDILQRQDNQNGYLDVVVRDMDYAFKERHYSNNQYQI